MAQMHVYAGPENVGSQEATLAKLQPIKHALHQSALP